MAVVIAVLVYANFFTHHYWGDYRYLFVACPGRFVRAVHGDLPAL